MFYLFRFHADPTLIRSYCGGWLTNSHFSWLQTFPDINLYLIIKMSKAYNNRNQFMAKLQDVIMKHIFEY